MERTVYLDHNASAPIRPQSAEAMTSACALTGNASSVHRYGRLARRAVEDAREEVAALVGASPAGIVFTSGGTEANNLAIRGAGRLRVLVSAVEHLSVLRAGADLEIIAVDGDGVIDLQALASLLEDETRPALVSLMLANNETGVIQPVAAAVEIAHRHGALVHCDAVQAAGKIPVDMMALGLDYLSLSAHKICGPAGTGALVVADGAPLAGVAFGGGQERGRRAGTENLPGIAGFGVAARLARAALEEFAGLARRRDGLERRILDLAPAVRIFGAASKRLPNTSCFTLPGMTGETQVMALDLAGVAVSAGSACSSGKIATSHVLEAMGVDKEIAVCAIRVSLGWTSTENDIDTFIRTWTAVRATADAALRAAAAA